MICNMMKGTQSTMTKESFKRMCDLNYNYKDHNKSRRFLKGKQKRKILKENPFCKECELGKAIWKKKKDIWPENISWIMLDDIIDNEEKGRKEVVR